MAYRQVISLIFLSSFGCGDPESAAPPDTGVVPTDAWAEVGTGLSGFEEMAADSEQVLVAGPQGGHHFIVTARMQGLEPGDPEMPGTIYNPATRFTVWNQAGEQIDIDPPAYRLGYQREDDIYVLPSGHIIQVREDEVPAMYGVPVRIAVEVTDATGAQATDERWILPVEDPSVGDLPE